MKHLWKWRFLLLSSLTIFVGFLFITHNTYEPQTNPMRAIWLRPTETTTAQVETHVQQIKDAGLNTVFLETVFNGYTIFPVKYDATCQNPNYKGFDVLQAYIKACHSRGMQLHCWVESFYIGTDSKDNGGPVVKAHKDWLLTDKEGNNWENTRYGKMYFLNPARPECREWIVGLYEILCSNYDVDGIQLDYVRYPEKTETTDFGFDAYTLNSYAAQRSVNSMTFTEYRQSMVTEYVRICSKRLRAIKPDLTISLSVYPFFEYGEENFMQCASEWMEQGYGDLLVPMAYYENIVESLTTDAINLAGTAANTVIGISAQNGFSEESLKTQAEIVLSTGAGIAIFEFESFFDTCTTDWRYTIFDDTLYNISPYR